MINYYNFMIITKDTSISLQNKEIIQAIGKTILVLENKSKEK